MARQVATYRFGPYEVRTRSRELYKHGTKLRLRPQSYQVLQLLVIRAGDVVPREELHNLLWPAQTIGDFELGVNTCIKELRGVLSDSASQPRYIETLPRLGYRLIAPMEVDESGGQAKEGTAFGLAAAKIAGTDYAARAGVKRKIPSRTQRRSAVAVGIALLLVAGFAVDLRWSGYRGRPEAMNGRQMLAVLPFENLTGDAAQEYFSDGLTEEMIGQLGRLDPGHLGVIARASMMHYKAHHEQLNKIGRELRVQYVLEGSVRRDGERVRVSAELIQMKDQTHVWSRQYDREISNLLILQEEIAREIAGEIQVTLGESKHITAVRETPLSPSAMEAHDLSLKGQFFWNKRTAQSLQQAIDCFQQSIAKDPSYSRAYAGLADSYALMSAYSLAPQTEYMPKARAAALRALEIDETLAEAHTALALIVENYDWDWQTAEKEFLRGIELDPNYATGHQWYAQYLTKLGRFDEALRESERARQLDPLSLIIAADDAAILYFSRRYDRAIEQCRAVLEMEPNFPRCHVGLIAYVEKGSLEEAVADLEKWRKVDDTPWIWSWQAYVYGRAGQEEQARRSLKKLQQLKGKREMDPAAILFAYIGMGDREQSFAWLEKAYSQHSSVLTTLKVEPIYDPLRGDPRFQELLRRMRLAE